VKPFFPQLFCNVICFEFGTLSLPDTLWQKNLFSGNQAKHFKVYTLYHKNLVARLLYLVLCQIEMFFINY